MDLKKEKIHGKNIEKNKEFRRPHIVVKTVPAEFFMSLKKKSLKEHLY